MIEKDMAAAKILQPPHWVRPKGYANGVAAQGRTVFVCGMIGWDAHGHLVAKDIVGQVRQTLRNIVDVLAEGGAKPEHIVRMTWYVVNKKEYVDASKEIGAVYREIIGTHYPAMTAVLVADLMEDRARVEIEVTAMVPE
jgi:enamine deaminase RidA (YjgF/YER057c/UK114 family)